MTLYLCNGWNPDCDELTYSCWRKNSDCKHTTHPEYAIGDICKDPENHPERFEKVEAGYATQYWEREDYYDKPMAEGTTGLDSE